MCWLFSVMSYDHNPCVFYEVAIRLETMFNQNGLLRQKVCRYQGRTLNDILMRADIKIKVRHLMAAVGHK